MMCWTIAAVVLTLVICLGCVELKKGPAPAAKDPYACAQRSTQPEQKTRAAPRAPPANATRRGAPVSSRRSMDSDFMKENASAFETNKGVGFCKSWQDGDCATREAGSAEKQLSDEFQWNPPTEDATAKNIAEMKAPDKKTAQKAANLSAMHSTSIRSPDGLNARSKGLDPMAFARPAIKVVLNQRPVSFLDSEARQNVVMSMTGCEIEASPDGKACSFHEC